MKIAIGCLVQWYESEIAPTYFQSLRTALDKFKKTCPQDEVIVDVIVCSNQNLEKAISAQDLINCMDKIRSSAKLYGITIGVTKELVTIASYRRIFNEMYCELADVLMWGETDMLLPSQAFLCIKGLHEGVSKDEPKYLATFGCCKMWDNSWKPLEHPDFTDKPFIEGDTTNWWSLRYPMTIAEMEEINSKTENIDLTRIRPHKFNGCGLVISSEVIKSGVNIPKSIFFIHEDTAFMLMTQKVLGDIPQYHFRNVLLVHNRKHPLKRTAIAGEEGLDKSNPGLLRSQHSWYEAANKKCEENCYNLFNPKHKAWTWKDVLSIT